MRNVSTKLLLATLLGISAAPLPLKSLTPRLTNIQYDEHAFRFQKDEFGMQWDKVWASFYDTEEDFSGFMNHFFDHACKPPKRIAIEPSPHEMLVCAHKCPDGYLAVLKVSKSKRRTRTCKRER